MYICLIYVCLVFFFLFFILSKSNYFHNGEKVFIVIQFFYNGRENFFNYFEKTISKIKRIV